MARVGIIIFSEKSFEFCSAFSLKNKKGSLELTFNFLEIKTLKKFSDIEGNCLCFSIGALEYGIYGGAFPCFSWRPLKAPPYFEK